MNYLAFDVGKGTHESLFLEGGDQVRWRLSFRPNRAGLRALEEKLQGVDPKSVIVGLEASGPYWQTLYVWLLRWAPERVIVLNPLQTRAFRNANLRGSKTDRLDVLSIARLLAWSHQTLSAAHVPEERQAAAREISRLRTELIQERSKQLVRLDGLLCGLFPEFAGVLKLNTKTGRAVLRRWPSPHRLAEANPEELVEVLRQSSRGRLKAKTAQLLQEVARQSVGIPDPFDSRAFAVRSLVELAEQLEQQITQLGKHLDTLLEADAETLALLASVPGFGEETVRTWQAEALPIERYQAKDGASRLVAAVGIDAQLKQSGRYAGRVKMSKRGNRYLRRALILAARSAARVDPQFRAILQRHIARGKHYNVAISHVARKLLHVLYSVLTKKKPYVLPSEYLLGVVTEPQLCPAGA